MDSATLDRMKRILREDDIPFFTDADLEFYVNENNGDVDGAIYQCLIIKSEESTLTVDGLTTADTSSYFKRLARRYRPWHSGVIGGG